MLYCLNECQLTVIRNEDKENNLIRAKEMTKEKTKEMTQGKVKTIFWFLDADGKKRKPKQR